MTKQQQLLVGVAVALLALYWFKNRVPNFKAAYAEGGEGDVATQDDYFMGGGGSGYVPGGVDDSDSLNNDPNSNYTESVPSDDSDPIVGAVAGGNYTKPYVSVRGTLTPSGPVSVIGGRTQASVLR